jgi:hypothetical protein
MTNGMANGMTDSLGQGKRKGRLLTALCAFVVLALALRLAWSVADACFALRLFRWDRRQAAFWADDQPRRPLIARLRRYFRAGPWGASDPAQVARKVGQALRETPPPADVRYAVAAIDGRLVVAEMPPRVLHHHCTLHRDGWLYVDTDEDLLAAIWEKALRESTVVPATGGPSP